MRGLQQNDRQQDNATRRSPEEAEIAIDDTEDRPSGLSAMFAILLNRWLVGDEDVGGDRHRLSLMGERSDGSIYDGTVTLDPGRVEWAWDRLGRDTWALEVGALPHVLHVALADTLKERGWIE